MGALYKNFGWVWIWGHNPPGVHTPQMWHCPYSNLVMICLMANYFCDIWPWEPLSYFVKIFSVVAPRALTLRWIWVLLLKLVAAHRVCACLSTHSCSITVFSFVHCYHYYSVKCKKAKTKSYKYASCPDWRISSHADRRSLRNTNSWQHWPSPAMQRPVFHSTHGPRLSSQVCRTALTTVKRVIDFSIFD